MREELAVKNLKDVKEILDRLGVRYWIDAGTLLGAVRNGKIIEWEHDIDLVTIDDCFEKIALAVPELKARGFDVRFANLKIRKNIRQKSFSLTRFGLPLDIWIYYTRGEYALFTQVRPTGLISRGVHLLQYLLRSPDATVQPKFRFIVRFLKQFLSLFPYKWKKSLSNAVWPAVRISSETLEHSFIPKHYFEKLGTIKFYDMMFNVPSDTEKYLEYRYGRNWKTPDKRWVHDRDSPILRIQIVRGMHKK